MKTKVLSFLMIAFLAVFTACNDDDDNNNNKPMYDDEITAPDDFDPADLKGNIQSGVTVTLKANTDYLLTGALNVLKGAELVIEPGTEIKAKVGGADVFVTVHPGAVINAKGTADEPIVITSGAGVPRSGDWGGLILAGYAKINNAGAEGTALAEVAGVTYGGDKNDDSSGELSHLICKYTGARISGEQEFNGITFYGVGSGTKVDNIAVMHGDDDGVEFFGGTVNATNVLIVNVKDDMFDWTDGWTGSITNGYGKREAGFLNVTEDPRGFEGDSNGKNNAATPVSNPTFTDMTIVNDAEAEMVDMVKVRRGSGATINNLLLSVGEEGVIGDLIDLTDSKGDALTSTTVVAKTNVEGGTIKHPAAGEANVTVEEGVTTGGANTAAFTWTGYEF
ncbi:hypothetical protein DMA11_14430 [Marinilabiliaceae bacterium JC017]|nr:hypothetical protein DMA11_14430 [Marinilabiliaceae bacterium JC017]